MTAFRLISPHAAIQILEAAEIGGDLRRFLVSLAIAGVVKGHARMISTEVAGADHTEIRESRIDRRVWRRVASENKVADLFDSGSVDLAGAGGGIGVFGIRFDLASVASAAADHGSVTRPAVKWVTVQMPAVATALGKSAVPKPATRPEATAGEPVQARRAALELNTVALSKAETADVRSVSIGTINNLIRRGQLEIKKIGRRTLVQADSVRALLA